MKIIKWTNVREHNNYSTNMNNHAPSLQPQARTTKFRENSEDIITILMTHWLAIKLENGLTLNQLINYVEVKDMKRTWDLIEVMI